MFCELSISVPQPGGARIRGRARQEAPGARPAGPSALRRRCAVSGALEALAVQMTP